MTSIYIAIDDTDSVKGGCTTFLLTQIIELCERFHLFPVGYPALVRLNPNIPYKTRGNGALALQVSFSRQKEGVEEKRIGQIMHTPIFSHEEGFSPERPENSFLEEVFEASRQLVKKVSRHNEKGTNPGIVLTLDHFEIINYVMAVRGVYSLEYAKTLLSDTPKTYFHCMGNGRGVIGCIGALSWLQNYRQRKLDHTYELLSYRPQKLWGSPRKISTQKVKVLDASIPGSYNNYDYKNRIPLIYPNSPCPVLFGVRGNNAHKLQMSLDILDTVEMERWQLFVSNQGTDDHLQKKKIGSIENYSSVITEGYVCQSPVVIKGGHVFFSISDKVEGNGNTILACAFEPTKSFREKVKCLVKGDLVRLSGGAKARELIGENNSALEGLITISNPSNSLAINIEKMEVLSLVTKMEKVSNPLCPACEVKMGSMGRGQGYRCRKCHHRALESEAVFREIERDLQEHRMYEVDAVALRHLSKPLARMNKELGACLDDVLLNLNIDPSTIQSNMQFGN